MLLKREGWNLGKKLVYRLYREDGLALRDKPRRSRSAAASRRERGKVTAPNQVWSLDFVADQLADGRRFRASTVVDVCTRESLVIEVGQSLKGKDVVRALSRIGSQRGTPNDNAYVESFNGTLRAECLDAHWFATLTEAKQVIEAWRQECNESRPHGALGEGTPNEIASEFAASRELTGKQTAEDSLSG